MRLPQPSGGQVDKKRRRRCGIDLRRLRPDEQWCDGARRLQLPQCCLRDGRASRDVCRQCLSREPIWRARCCFRGWGGRVQPDRMAIRAGVGQAAMECERHVHAGAAAVCFDRPRRWRSTGFFGGLFSQKGRVALESFPEGLSVAVRYTQNTRRVVANRSSRLRRDTLKRAESFSGLPR